jgi:hypothetical protein
MFLTDYPGAEVEEVSARFLASLVMRWRRAGGRRGLLR